MTEDGKHHEHRAKEGDKGNREIGADNRRRRCADRLEMAPLGGRRLSKRIGDLDEMRRLVGIAAAPARGRFGDLVEGVQSGDRREHGMPAVEGDDGVPPRVRLAVDHERRRAE
jgi:hypothetical protein